VDLLAEIDALTEAGRRAPGSDAERRAARHLENRLRELGRDAEPESIDAWPGWPLAYALLAGLGVVGSVLSVSVPLLGAALALAAALLTFLDAGVLLPTLRRALGRRASQNVVSWGDRDRPGLLVLVAHYDAGRGGLALGRKAQERRASFGHLVRRPLGALEPLFWAELAVLACCLLRLPGLAGTLLTAIQFVPTVVLIVATALLVDVALAGTKSGENDNASGVALALRLAERFGPGGDSLEHFDVHVLFTGSQKAVTAGMRAFLKRHEHELAPERTVFLGPRRGRRRHRALHQPRGQPAGTEIARPAGQALRRDRPRRRGDGRVRRTRTRQPRSERRLRRALGRLPGHHDQLSRPDRLRGRARG
jgi:hypothetical protein